MGLKDVLHKIVDVAAGDNARPDLHDEIDALGEDSAVEPAPGVPAEAEAPEPSPDEPVAAPEPAPVDDGAQVQEQVQEDGSAEAES